MTEEQKKCKHDLGYHEWNTQCYKCGLDFANHDHNYINGRCELCHYCEVHKPSSDLADHGYCKRCDYPYPVVPDVFEWLEKESPEIAKKFKKEYSAGKVML